MFGVSFDDDDDDDDDYNNFDNNNRFIYWSFQAVTYLCTDLSVLFAKSL